MNKGDVVGGVIVAACFAFAVRDWVVGERSQAEIDEAMARTDTRCVKREKKPLWLKKLEKKWMATGRLGEAKRQRVR